MRGDGSSSADSPVASPSVECATVRSVDARAPMRPDAGLPGGSRGSRRPRTPPARSTMSAELVLPRRSSRTPDARSSPAEVAGAELGSRRVDVLAPARSNVRLVRALQRRGGRVLDVLRRARRCREIPAPSSDRRPRRRSPAPVAIPFPISNAVDSRARPRVLRADRSEPRVPRSQRVARPASRPGGIRRSEHGRARR